MGYNSTVIIMNDCLNEIRKDQRFGEKVSDAILKLNTTLNKGIDISSGYCCNAATVVDCHHADNTSLIAVGGNCASVIPYVGGSAHHTIESQERILREWADRMGFRLVKKTIKR